MAIYVFAGDSPAEKMESKAEAQEVFLHCVTNAMACSVWDGAEATGGRIVGVKVWNYDPDNNFSLD